MANDRPWPSKRTTQSDIVFMKLKNENLSQQISLHLGALHLPVGKTNASTAHKALCLFAFLGVLSSDNTQNKYLSRADLYCNAHNEGKVFGERFILNTLRSALSRRINFPLWSLHSCFNVNLENSMKSQYNVTVTDRTYSR